MYDPNELNIGFYTRLGGGSVLALCAFHPDTKPSMSVHLTLGVFHCFACGVSGSIKRLVAETGGKLALADTEEFDPEGTQDERSDAITSIVVNAPLALNSRYLESRGVTNAQVKRHNIVNLTSAIGFPLMGEDGVYRGIQMRRTLAKGWRYILLGNRPKLWMNAYAMKQELTVVTEGIFGALNAERNRIAAVSTLSAAAADEVPLVNGRALVAFDDDEAGYYGVARVLISTPDSVAFVPGVETDNIGYDVWRKMLCEEHWLRSPESLLSFVDNPRRLEEYMARRAARAMGKRMAKTWL